MRNRWLGVAVIALVFEAGFATHQLLVPDIEARQRALFRDFEELERLGAYVIGADGENLGRIARNGPNALGNKYDAGSPYKHNGLFNPYSKYGSQYSSTSAFNKYATDPPKVVVKMGSDLYLVGVLTTNRYLATQGQRINPHLLRAWLESQ